MSKYTTNIKEAASLYIMGSYVKPANKNDNINQFAISINTRQTLETCLMLDNLKADFYIEQNIII